MKNIDLFIIFIKLTKKIKKYDKFYKKNFRGGIFLALAACSSDSVFNDVEQQTDQELMMGGTSFNPSSPGSTSGIGVGTPPGNYFSPWDIWFNRGAGYVDLQPSYLFDNGDGGVDGNYSPYTLHVYAWAGLAYFDGDDDMTYTDMTPAGASYPMSVATHPNLTTNGSEVGSLIRTTAPLTFFPNEEARIEDKVDHLPMQVGGVLGNAPKYASTPPPYNWAMWAGGFDFSGAVNAQEEFLLRNYGKIFFYEVVVEEAGTLIGTYLLYPQISTLAASTPYWLPVNDPSMTQINSNAINATHYKLFYLTNGTPFSSTAPNVLPATCNSYEIVLDARRMNERTITGGSITKTLRMDFLAHNNYYWQNSALSLRVY